MANSFSVGVLSGYYTFAPYFKELGEKERSRLEAEKVHTDASLASDSKVAKRFEARGISV